MTGEPWWADWRRRPLRAAALGLIRFYQLWISPALPPSCRYYPSCSAYALTAVERFGPLVGGWLAVKRLLRCNPFTRGRRARPATAPRGGRHGRDDAPLDPPPVGRGTLDPTRRRPAPPGAPA